jgi:integrase
MRRSELLGLKWRNMDLDLLTLSVVQVLHQLPQGRFMFREPTSGKSRRLIDLTPASAAAMREWRAQLEVKRLLLGSPVTRDDLVFQQLDGRPLLPTA